MTAGLGPVDIVDEERGPYRVRTTAIDADGVIRATIAAPEPAAMHPPTVVDGQGPPPHRHAHEDETIVVLQGTLRVYCGVDTWTGGPGTTYFLPWGLTHTFMSVDGAATTLFLVTPGHLDEYFRLKEEASTPAEVAALVSRFLQ